MGFSLIAHKTRVNTGRYKRVQEETSFLSLATLKEKGAVRWGQRLNPNAAPKP